MGQLVVLSPQCKARVPQTAAVNCWQATLGGFLIPRAWQQLYGSAYPEGCIQSQDREEVCHVQTCMHMGAHSLLWLLSQAKGALQTSRLDFYVSILRTRLRASR